MTISISAIYLILQKTKFAEVPQSIFKFRRVNIKKLNIPENQTEERNGANGPGHLIQVPPVLSKVF